MIRKSPEGSAVEIEVRIDAPADEVWRALIDPELMQRWFPLHARGEGRVGGVVELSWGDEAWWAMEVVAAEEGKHVRFQDQAAPGAEDAPRLAVDYHLTSEGGSTVVRLVHSGFAPGADWDEYLDALDAGWAYFMRHLKLYMERHRGVARVVASARPRAKGNRAAIWTALLDVYGVEPGGFAQGESCNVDLGAGAEPAVVEAAVVDRVLSVRLPGRNDGMLMLEIESAGEKGRVGMWVSTYGVGADQVAGLQATVDTAATRLTGRLSGEASAP